MPKPLRMFREHDFFGVLLPGMASVMFLYMLISQEITISFSEGIVFVGVFAFGQSLQNAERLHHGQLKPLKIEGSLWVTRDEWRRSLRPIWSGRRGARRSCRWMRGSSRLKWNLTLILESSGFT